MRGKYLQGQPCPGADQKSCVTQILTCDLFVVANLLVLFAKTCAASHFPLSISTFQLETRNALPCHNLFCPISFGRNLILLELLVARTLSLTVHYAV